jgi:hypothetical protein
VGTTSLSDGYRMRSAMAGDAEVEQV